MKRDDALVDEDPEEFVLDHEGIGRLAKLRGPRDKPRGGIFWQLKDRVGGVYMVRVDGNAEDIEGTLVGALPMGTADFHDAEGQACDKCDKRNELEGFPYLK
jgi:hypothetical protein